MDIESILAISMSLGIPILVIIGVFTLKFKKMSMSEVTSEDKKMISQLISQNEDLQNRLQNMETIVSELDTDLLKLNAHTKSDLEIELARLKQKEKLKG